MRLLRYTVLAVVAAAMLVLVWPGLYIYSVQQEEVYRVNRFTGVKEHSTEFGWMTDTEEYKHAERKIVAEQQRDRHELLAAIRGGKVARVYNSSGQLQVTYTDYTTRVFNFWPNTVEPLLTALKEHKVYVESTL